MLAASPAVVYDMQMDYIHKCTRAYVLTSLTSQPRHYCP